MPRSSILLVNPLDEQREMYAEALTHSGFIIFQARTGEEAFVIATEHPLHAVVAEVGSTQASSSWTLIDRLRHDPRTADVPVFALGSRNLDTEREQAEQFGVHSYFIIPLIPDELVRALRALPARPETSEV